MDVIYSFIPLAEKTVILVPSFYQPCISHISKSLGLDADILGMGICLMLGYPLGYIMNKLPYGKIRHIFSFLSGVFLLQCTVQQQWIHIFITSLVSYVFLLLLPSSYSKNVVPIFTMLYLSLGHVHRQYTNYGGWDMDFTTAQMILTIKLYSLAYNLYDGYILKTGNMENRATLKCYHVAIRELPGFIEYLGYVFCFSTLLAGPAYEYKLYVSSCDGSKLYNKYGKPHGTIPSVVLPTLRPFLLSIIFLAIFVIGRTFVPFLNPSNPQYDLPTILEPSLLTKTWAIRFLYTYAAIFVLKCKFYYVFKTTEGTNNIWMAGFDGFEQNETGSNEKKPLGWTTSVNVDILQVETGSNIKAVMAAWNKKTANWLFRYVYIRTNGSLFFTYFISAFWHGFYPGYYLSFLSLAFFTTVERLGRKKLNYYFIQKRNCSFRNFLVTTICLLNVTLIMVYSSLPMHLLSWEWSVAGLKTHYFIGHILGLILLFVFYLLPIRKIKII